MKESLRKLYNEKNYDAFFIKLNEYINRGYAIDYDLLGLYFLCLLKSRKYDELYTICNNLLKITTDKDIIINLAWYISRTGRASEAEEILLSIDKLPINGLYKLGKIYFSEGKLTEAYDCFEKVSLKSVDKKCIEDSKMHMDKISKMKLSDSLPEIYYDSFVKSGKSIEVGNIVNLKKLDSIKIYAKTNSNFTNHNLSYLVWKVDGSKVYLFPLTTIRNKNTIKISYFNSKFNSYVIPNICSTNIDNIYSVKDKISNKIVECIVDNVLYLNNIHDFNELINENGDVYIDKSNNSANLYDLIETNNIINNEKHNYFVVGVNDNYYQVIEVYDLNYGIISSKIMYINKDEVSRVVALRDEQKNFLINIFNNKNKELRIGSVIMYNGVRKLIINKQDNNYICIDYPLSNPDNIIFYKVNMLLDFNFEFEVSNEYLSYIENLTKNRILIKK